MKLVILAVRDRQLDAYMQPFFAQAVGAGIRAFGDMLNQADSEPAKHPEDYDLYKLGYFDPSTGMVETNEELRPVQVAVGKNLVHKPN